jgi:hypothetical protein
MHKGAIRMEDTVRKLCLTLAAGLAVLSTGALPSHADGLPSGTGIYNPVYRSTDGSFEAGIHQARYVCTHFWNGRWHRRQICFWVQGRRHHHRHHHHSY